MPDLNWNIKTWNKEYNWKDQGEEWSQPWGGSETQWFSTILPRIHRFLPNNKTLEIAPGFGRWTKFLVENTNEYVGVDISEKCINHCSVSFSEYNHAKFFVNDGLSLSCAEDCVFDFIFSFDSLVHANLDVHESYIPQILSKLSPKGFAFIHHSNWAKSGTTINDTHHRAEDVCYSSYANIVKNNQGHVVLQELINWGGEYQIDAFTIFSKNKINDTIFIDNDRFNLESEIASKVHSPYSKIEL